MLKSFSVNLQILKHDIQTGIIGHCSLLRMIGFMILVTIIHL